MTRYNLQNPTIMAKAVEARAKLKAERGGASWQGLICAAAARALAQTYRDGVRARDIVELTGLKPTQVSVALRRAIQAGYVAREGYRYFPAARVPDLTRATARWRDTIQRVEQYGQTPAPRPKANAAVSTAALAAALAPFARAYKRLSGLGGGANYVPLLTRQSGPTLADFQRAAEVLAALAPEQRREETTQPEA